MSVRDSLLDYITEDEIKKNTRKTRYKSKKFSVAELEDSMKLKTYKSLLVAFKKNDSKYIIYSITGYSAMEIKSCLNKQKEIYNEISELFTDIKKYDEGKRNHPAYKNSYTYDMYFKFKSEDLIVVSCYDFSEKETVADALAISIDTKQFNDFLNNEGHK